MKIEENITDLLKSCEILEKNKGEFTLFQYVNKFKVLFAYIKENSGDRSTLIYNSSLPVATFILGDDFKNKEKKIKKSFSDFTKFSVDGITSSPDDFGQAKRYLQIDY